MKGRIKNDGDWYLASICMRCEPLGQPIKALKKRATTWINTHLIHALSPQDAYRKAIAIGRKGAIRYKSSAGMRKWRFVGIWDLIPIYDDLADGEEILWTDYGALSAETAQKRCLTRAKAIEKGQNRIRNQIIANNGLQSTSHKVRRA